MAARQNGMRVSRTSNLVYLPFVYFLPYDLVHRFPTIGKLPRKVREVFYDEGMMEIVNSDQFLNEITDAIAILVFPHLGFGGKFEQYTGYSLLYKVTYLSQFWASLLEQHEIGWGLNKLFQFRSFESIPYFDEDFIKNVISDIVKQGKKRDEVKALLTVQKEFPCDEDFEQGFTNIRIDFIRRWYHTRSKVGVMASLEEALNTGDGDFYSKVAVDPRDMTEIVASEDYCQRFKALLKERDLEILELREDGYTYEEIAGIVGYETHSAVVKRIQAIKEIFLEYEKAHK